MSHYHHQSPLRAPRDDRDSGEHYYPSDRSLRPPSDDRDHYRSHSHSHRSSYSPSRHRSRSRSRSPWRERSPPRDAPKGPRAYRSRSGSRDRSYRGGGESSRGRGGATGTSYYDRDAPRSRSRSRSRDKEWFGGPLSRDIIIEGLAAEMDEDDIMRELSDRLNVEGIEKITIIRERKTGVSRQFGFIHFNSTQESKRFLEQYYPNLSLGPSMDRCRVAFSREREPETEKRGKRRDEAEEEWRCRVCLLLNYPRRMECFRCSTPKSEITLTGTLTHPTPTHFTNDGQRDMASSPPSQFLIFRNLESGVTEELLSKGVFKLTVPDAETPESSKIGPIGAKESSVQRVLLVRDRRTNESWRYGFVEFSTISDAQAALAMYNKMEKFTISSKPVTVSYIHPGVFVPVYNALSGAERFTFLPLSAGGVGGGLRLAYWDEEGFVSELVVAKISEERSKMLGKNKERDSAKGGKEGSEEKKGKKRKAEKEAAGISKKSVPAHLQFWQNRHSELHGKKPQTNQDTNDSNDSGSAPETEVSKKPNSTTAANKKPADQEETSNSESFADPNKIACLLCSRQFKTLEKLNEHERVSNLHLKNLKDPVLRAAATKKLTKAGITITAASSTPEYRDRAKERRQVFGKSSQPSSVSNSNKQKKQSNPATSATSAATAAAATAAEEPEQPPQPSKGAALLGKMGWTAGTGLGAAGEGRTEHVVAEMYSQGVGLGMKGGKLGDVEEAAKNQGAGGYGDFVRRTRERAKERFEGME